MEREPSQFFNLETTILSAKDALDCLTGRDIVILPMPNVRACNNLDEYFSKSISNAHRAKKDSSSTNSSSQGSSYDQRGSSQSREPFAVPLVRNFDRVLKKSADDSTTNLGFIVRPRKVRPDVFSRAEQLESNSGPFLHLKSRIEQVVKVIIRRRRKVPYISRVIEYKGTLVLFDKHMNIYLRDAIESFTYKAGDRLLKRARYRNDILVRGDNVILVS